MLQPILFVSNNVFPHFDYLLVAPLLIEISQTLSDKLENANYLDPELHTFLIYLQ